MIRECQRMEWKKQWKNLWNRKSWQFAPEEFRESTGEIINPARGWYQIYTFCAQEPFAPEETRWCMSAGDALALVLIDISAYRKCPVDDAGLENIRAILEWFGQQGKDVILRVVYDREGKGMEREPSEFALVRTHMTQIAELMQELEIPVFLYQGLLVGSWGEMHSSRYLTSGKLAQLEQVLKNNTDTSFYAVRSPMLWRWLRDLSSGCQAPGNPEVERMGVFDDGILGSDTDLGTFSYEERSEGSWLRPWCREDELQFMEQLCRQVPCGGEAVHPEEGIEGHSLEEHVKRLRAMQLTYLNRVHDERLLSVWRSWTWKSEDVWNGCSGYDYIGRHLGYRFVVRSATAVLTKRSDERCAVRIEIENVGFAGLYQEVELYLKWQLVDGVTTEEVISADLRRIAGGQRAVIEHETQLRAGKVFLAAKRKRDGMPVRFANDCKENENILLGTFTM